MGFGLTNMGRIWAGPGSFQQDSMPDGIVVIEAEHFTGREASATHDWVEQILATGERVMKGLPDDGFKQNQNFVGVSARLDYEVNFVHSGEHFIVMRGFGDDYRGDTLHVGLNGEFVETADRMFATRNTLSWSNETLDDVVASFIVDSPGYHVVNVWMREDGFMLDKLLISRNPAFFPTGDGPPESEREGFVQESDVDPLQPVILDVRSEASMLMGSFRPGPGIEAYHVMVRPDLFSDPVDLGSTTTLGFDWLLDPGLAGQGYFSIEAIPVEEERTLCAMVLNRLAYGPTPDLLDRVMNGLSPLGGQGYIDEQMRPELLNESADALPDIEQLAVQLASQGADLTDLQAWHALRAVYADRQLLEVLAQFINNHFVTYSPKTYDWLRDEAGLDRSDAYALAANMEYREMEAWKEVLLNPNGTFLDLLEISAESPSMIIYLDTIENAKEEPNENYARELLELFCMGVDNGYDQADIEEMARAWTGWRIGLAHPDDDKAIPDPYAQSLLIATGSEWLFKKGDTAPASDWFQPGFTPGQDWLNGTAGIGYGDGDDTTIIDDMRQNYSSLYFRKNFVVSEASAIDELTVRIFIDDGYVALLNGMEIGRHNAGEAGDPHPNEVLATTYEQDGVWTVVRVDNASSNVLVDGNNVLAVHGFNHTLGSSDFSFDVEVLEGPRPVYRQIFDDVAHDEGEKVLFPGKKVNARFGMPFSGQDYELRLASRTGISGQLDGYEVLQHLATLPYTMEFISTKLCRLFVHEDFHPGYYMNLSTISEDAQLIRDCMLAWDAPGPDGRKGNIRQVLSAIFSSTLFRSQTAARQKLKTPFEYTVSSVRALRSHLGGGLYSAETDGFDLLTPMDRMGMELFYRAEPNGWPEDGGNWVDTGSIAERMRFVQNFVVSPQSTLKQVEQGSDGVDNIVDPVSLLHERLPASDHSNAVAVSEFFLNLLFTAVGSGNLELEREECLILLNSDSTGVPDNSPFVEVAPGTEEYDQRIRSLVGLLLCSPKFHEQ